MAGYVNTTTGLVNEIGNPELNPQLTAGKTPTNAPIGTIDSSNISPNNYTPPPSPPNPTNPAPTAAGGAAQINANHTYTTPSGATYNTDTGVTTPPPSSTDSISQAYKDYLASLTPSPSAINPYTADYNASGIASKQTDYNTKTQAVLDAQAKLDAVNAKLAGINAEAKAIPIRDQQNAEGRGITAAGLEPLTAGELRMNALKALPLQAEALSAQAEVAAAQGNAKLAESIYQQAQDHLDKLFQIHSTDATNMYNYKIKLIDKAYEYATEAQKIKLEEQKSTLASQNSQYNAFINDVRQIAAKATESGQASLSTKITQLISGLDPNSKTFKTDFDKVNAQIATLEGQIVPKPTQEQQNVIETSNIQSKLTAAIGGKYHGDNYTDPDLYMRLRATSKINPTEFDNRFAGMLNPRDMARLGITSAQGAVPKITLTPENQNFLIGAGIPKSEFDAIQNFISQYGLQAFYNNNPHMTQEQKDALDKVYVPK